MSNEQKFIKVIDLLLTKQLAEAGFSYIKEGNVFAFRYSPELIALLGQEYEKANYVIENRLRF